MSGTGTVKVGYYDAAGNLIGQTDAERVSELRWALPKPSPPGARYIMVHLPGEKRLVPFHAAYETRRPHGGLDSEGSA